MTHVHFGSRPKWTGRDWLRPKQRLCFSCPNWPHGDSFEEVRKLVQIMAYTKIHWLAVDLDAGKPLAA